MLRPILILFFCLICYSEVFSQQVVVTDDAAYQSAATSAVLDVKSSNKGMLLPRVALNSLNDATTVTSPVNGLLIYNNGTGTLTDKGVYYWNDSVWVKTLNGGYGANRITITDNGTVILNGGASCFDDLVVNPYVARNSGVSAPNWTEFVPPGIFSWEYLDVSTKELFFMVQMPHQWKEGSNIYPHVHWSVKTALGTNRVKWILDYQWVDLGSTYSTSNFTTLSGSELVQGASRSGAAYEHFITPINSAAMSGNGHTLSSIIVCRLKRDGDLDNFTGTAFLLSFDFHYEIDSFGSNNEYIK